MLCPTFTVDQSKLAKESAIMQWYLVALIMIGVGDAKCERNFP